ncbi:hypothetical protein BCR39DRAFT_528594 [Naematelia encephala]|uniref:Uncharacterized protein n=1 Tax=Naematelia encephala TaxID=71784 RepID=A0A1Y2B8W6_9TREE|nr:hypothetical protein BCR39DRAFT_528594 [Naematelia encephala]
MADLKTFLSLLETTIRAPRLSGSKVQQLTSSLPALFSSDSQIVSAHLRLNKSLAPAVPQRISSLYVFDALARGCKGQPKGSGMLGKMEGVVESFVGGMLDDGKGGVWTEGKVSDELTYPSTSIF